MSLCLISAFLDLGRQHWSEFKRSWTEYVEAFLPYVTMNQEMIVFMDDCHKEQFHRLCRTAPHIKIIPINREWMQANIHAYRKLPREREIMASKAFQTIVEHRLHHPECSEPEYVMMTHAKIDFVCYVIEQKLSTAEYYAWTDFGYFKHPSHIPRNKLNLSKFDLERVNLQAVNELTEQDFDIMYTLTHAPERIGGFFFLGSSSKLREYQELYHKICHEFHEQGIVDDEQHIMLRCIGERSDLFKVWNLGGWHLTYVRFQI